MSKLSMTRRDLLKLAGTGLLASGLGPIVEACGGSSGTGTKSSPFVMAVGHDSSIDHPYQKGWEAFKAEVESKTNGGILVRIFPNSQLGNEEAMATGLKAGTVDGVVTSSGTWVTGGVPEASIFNMPFVFKDPHHGVQVAEGSLGQGIASKIKSAMGAEVVGWGQLGDRDMWNSKRPIKTIDDVKGLKMRVQPQPIGIATYSALGALPVPIAFSELYTSLQTHVVDGADNGPVDIYDSKFYQVTKYLTFTRHFIIVNALLVSNLFMNKLSPDFQAIVRAAGKVAGKAESDASDKANADDVAKLPGLGMQLNELDASERQKFADAMKPVYTKFADQVGGMSVIQQILSGS